jgi:hypothetical protein
MPRTDVIAKIKKNFHVCPFKETLQKSSLEKLHGAQVSKKQRVTKINSPFEPWEADSGNTFSDSKLHSYRCPHRLQRE